MKLHYDITNAGVTVTLYNGERWTDEEKEIVSSASFAVADVPEELETNEGPKSLAAYGLAKLLQDRTSQDSGAENKMSAMAGVFDVLKDGKWRAYKEGSSRKAAIDPLLAQAVAQIKKAPLAAVTAKLQTMPAEERKAIAALEPVQKAIAKLRAEADVEVDLSL